MLVQILASNQFIFNIFDINIKCVIENGYAALFESSFCGEEGLWLLDIDDVNTLSQAVEVIYEKYSNGELYNKLVASNLL